MANKQFDHDDNQVHIEQIDPRTELNDLEKTAILQFEIDKQEEELSKTQQFKLMNRRKKKVEVDLPSLKPSLFDTIKLKLSDLREAVEKKYEEQELPVEKQQVQVEEQQVEEVKPQIEEQQTTRPVMTQTEVEPLKQQKIKITNPELYQVGDLDEPIIKDENATISIHLDALKQEAERLERIERRKRRMSLYDTVIIKLDDLINKKSALKSYDSKKVTKIEKTKTPKQKFHLFKPKDITKMKKIKINVESEEFGRQLYNLNKIALTNLGLDRPKTVRKYSTINKLNKIEKVHISKHNYLKYQQKLNKFAINKLYYKLAPKESKKYKIYKTSVILSSIVFFITSAIIINWFIQGITINDLSNALVEDTPIQEVVDGGEVVSIEVPPEPEKKEEYSNKKSLYWKYLNTPLSSVDFTELKKQNKDTVAWLIVKNTNVNYPVVQTTNNDYYLHHSFNKKVNGAGWVFADFRDNFTKLNQNLVIYAHGRKDKVMFGSLTNTLKPNWYKNTDNQIIQLSTLKYNTMWQIFSIYKVQAESYYITTDFGSTKSFENFIKKMKERSIYDFKVDVTANDKLLTLSTCYNDNGIRLVVQAKLVKIQERK